MSNNNTPLISVIIAIYNPGKYLRPCLDSIVNQTYRNLEIILVDDGSTDDSLTVCKEYAEKDSRIIVHHKENSGVSATRNKGIELSHGEYLSFIDSDDYIEKDTYEYLVGVINEHGADIVDFEHYITFPNKEIVHKSHQSNYGLFDRKDAMRILVKGRPFVWSKFLSRKTVDGIFFTEGIARGEDTLFAIQAADKAEKIYFDSRHLYHYVQSEESAVRGKFRKSQLTAIKLIDIYEPFFKEKYPELYDMQMGTMLNLMITLYYEMSIDEEPLRKEKAEAVKAFRRLYPKVNTKNLSSKRRNTFRLFRFSPYLSCLVRKTRQNMSKRKTK